MPREATPLLEALADAETGKAQTEKGDALDVYETASTAIDAGLVLEEGEVLKLPPTPDAVSPDLGDGDPDVERIHYEPESLINSRRGSVATAGSDARTPDLDAASAQQTMFPPLPPRLPARRRPVPAPPTSIPAATLPPYVPSDAPAVGIGLEAIDAKDPVASPSPDQTSREIEQHEAESTAKGAPVEDDFHDAQEVPLPDKNDSGLR